MILPRPTRAQILITSCLLFSLAFLIYGRSIDYPFVRFDDGLLIYDNPAIRTISFSTLKTIFTTYDPELYIPLTLLSYQIDFLIGGINPAVYHLQNILWHAINGVLVAWLLYWLLLLRENYGLRVTGLEKPETRNPQPATIFMIALFLAALFVVHPLNVEAVAWASARKDLLSAFFALASLLAYLSWSIDRSRRMYYVSLVLFSLGLLCKVTILTLPLIFIVIDVWAKQRMGKRMILEKIPFFILSIVFAVIALFGKAGQLESITPLETILVASKAIIFTVRKFFVPWGLSVLYPFNEPIALSDPRFFLPLLGLLGLMGLFGFLFFATRRKTHCQCVSTTILCAAFFLLALSPSLLNFAKGGTVYITSDRYAYAAMVGILVGLGEIFLAVLRRDVLAVRLYRKRLVYGCMAIVLLLFITLSIRQTKTWAGSEALFANAAKHYPDSHVAHNNLGNVLLEKKGDDALAKAITEYEQALQIAEDLPKRTGDTDPVTSKILSNLASALRQSGDTEVARKRYEEALEKNPVNPYAYLGLGIITATEGKIGEAEEQYRSALSVAAKFSPAYLNLGALYSASGRLEEALTAFEQGLAIDPFVPQAHFNRGVVLQKMNRIAEARTAYAKAVEIAPSFVAARINLGILEANRGHREKAIEQFQEVLRYDPGNAKATEALRQLRAN